MSLETLGNWLDLLVIVNAIGIYAAITYAIFGK